jgi:hypothetical protein
VGALYELYEALEELCGSSIVALQQCPKRCFSSGWWAPAGNKPQKGTPELRLLSTSSIAPAYLSGAYFLLGVAVPQIVLYRRSTGYRTFMRAP